MTEERFLLIIEGDEQTIFSAPLHCESVALVKQEIKKALQQRLDLEPNAGLGIFALALRTRLTFGKRSAIDAREWWSKLHIGRVPAIGAHDDAFQYTVDTTKIVSEEELALWRREPEEALLPSEFKKPMFEVVQIRDCV